MSIFSSLLKKPLQAIEAKISKAKYDAQVEVSVILAKLLLMIIMAFFLLVAIVLASIGLAVFINHQLVHPFYGYLWVGSGYLLLTIILLVLNKSGSLSSLFQALADRMVFGNPEEE